MANPRGFCAGVRRAIDIVNRAVKIFKEPIYVNHELVHNSYVIKEFRKKGVKFVEDINEIPDGSVLIFSAHGVSKKIKETAKARNFKIFDATCPLVSRVHSKVSRASRDCSEVILIGHSGHPEVKGTMGQYTNKFGKIYLVESEQDAFLLKVKNPNNLIFVTQTTLSIIDTKKIIEILYYRFPNISSLGKNDICYATTNRQESLNKLAKIVEVILVIGSENSSNSNRLVESIHFMNKPVYLIDSAKDVKKEWIRNIDRVGITAGASAPGILVDQVIEKLRLWSIKKFSVEEIHGKFENIFFKIPENLI